MLDRLLARFAIAVVLSGSCWMSACIFSSNGGTDEDARDAEDVSTLDTSSDTIDDASDTDASDAMTEPDTTDVVDADTDLSDASDTADALTDATDAADTDPDSTCTGDGCSACAASCEPRANAVATCDDAGCVYECKPDYSDLNGDLNKDNSDGCEGQCSAGSARSFYLDGDNDDYGDPDIEIKACPGDNPMTHVANNGDCDDSDDRVNPGYDGPFQSTASVGGTFDYNCNGDVEKKHTSEASCGISCDSDGGWEDSDEPDCGESATFVKQCGLVCARESETRTQGCK